MWQYFWTIGGGLLAIVLLLIFAVTYDSYQTNKQRR
jgi:hypothetical protein